MYKELHNEIFSKTECLTKEQIERLVNRQLTDKERYLIEKHLIDCPFCSEAVEGYTDNPPPIRLHELDQMIDREIASRKQTHFKRYLLAAASVALLMSIGWWGVHQINTSKQTLSINQKQEIKPQESIIPLQAEETTGTAADNTQKSLENNSGTLEKQATLTEQDIVQTSKTVYPKNEETEDITMEIFDESETAEIEKPAETSNNLEPISAEEEQDMFLSEAEEPETENIPPTTATRVMPAEKHVSKSYKSKKTSKYERKTLYVQNFKIYDYTNEYAKKEEAKKLAETISVPAALENESDNTTPFDSTVITQNTYVNVLENALENLKLKNYSRAITLFSEIEKKHPKDVNALFYKGVTYEQQGKYTLALRYFEKTLQQPVDIFYPEAKFHQAKLLAQTKQKKKAKKLLLEIIKENSYYKSQAQELLQQITNE